MEVWVSYSNAGKQIVLSVGCALVGLILVIGFRDFNVLDGENALAGFLLGALLLVIGVVGALTSGKQTVTIEPERRCIIVEDKTSLSVKMREIAFHDIVDIRVGFLGKKSNYVQFYYLLLKLRNGESYPLFAPGRFYRGSSDRPTVVSWKEKLARYIST